MNVRHDGHLFSPVMQTLGKEHEIPKKNSVSYFPSSTLIQILNVKTTNMEKSRVPQSGSPSGFLAAGRMC